ncbi:MAG TPA: phosphotransferase [Chitinophagaceae bacterium]|mgnify:CR=1 FL=1|nr:phosphotransferase [Chitinophagaceae bacterium]
MGFEIPGEVITAFTGVPVDDSGEFQSKIRIEKIGHGLINYSFKISGSFGPDLFLQQINKNVFQSPEAVQENYLKIWNFSISKENSLYIPSPRFFNKINSIFLDKNNNYWRAFDFVEKCITISKVGIPDQARLTAIAFARFTSFFEGFDPALLNEVIPHFHDLEFRFKQFKDALINSKNYSRIEKSSSLIAALKQRRYYVSFLDNLIHSGNLLKRVMHHDAKISNILFHAETGAIICPIDLDTMMPGYIFSDLGDLIRSMTAACDESEKDLSKVSVRKEFYNAIVSGYLQIMSSKMSDTEKQNIHFAGLMMFFMQALRFLTDYLNDDVYYQVKYPEQNFDRAINQLTHLKQLENLLEEDYQFKI